MGIRSPVSCASNAPSSNSASLKVERVMVRPRMVAMKRCWVTIASSKSRNFALRTKSSIISDSRHTASSGSFRWRRAAME